MLPNNRTIDSHSQDVAMTSCSTTHDLQQVIDQKDCSKTDSQSNELQTCCRISSSENTQHLSENSSIDVRKNVTRNDSQTQETSSSDSNTLEKNDTRNFAQDPSMYLESAVDRGYADVMRRFGWFQGHTSYTSKLRGDNIMMGKPAHSWDKYEEQEPHSSTPIARSDSIRNLLEAMHSIGIDLDNMRSKEGGDPPPSQPSSIFDQETNPREFNNEFLNLSRDVSKDNSTT